MLCQDDTPPSLPLLPTDTQWRAPGALGKPQARALTQEERSPQPHSGLPAPCRVAAAQPPWRELFPPTVAAPAGRPALGTQRSTGRTGGLRRLTPSLGAACPPAGNPGTPPAAHTQEPLHWPPLQDPVSASQVQESGGGCCCAPVVTRWPAPISPLLAPGLHAGSCSRDLQDMAEPSWGHSLECLGDRGPLDHKTW